MSDKTITGKPLHPNVEGWARAVREGKMGRREFLALSTAFGATAATAYGLMGVAMPRRALAQPQQGGVIRISMNIKKISDPRIYDWSEMGNVGRQMCENLVRWDKDFSFKPWLLEGWEVNETATEYLLHARQAATWTNGDQFNADDIIANLERWCDTSAEGNSASSRLTSIIDPDTGQLRVGAVEKVSEFTVKLSLEEPDITIIPGLSDYPMLVVHRNFDAMGADLAANPIGTGPFDLESIDVGVGAVLRARESGWWGGRVYLDGIEYIDFGTDPAAELSAFEAEEIDLNYQTTGDYVDLMESLGLDRSEVVTAATIVARMNVNQPPFTDKRVRNAMQMAVDNQTVLAIGYNNYGEVAENHHVGPMHEEYFKLPPLTRDVDGARALLEEAGHLDTEIELISIDDDWRRNSTDAIAAQLRDAGFNIKRTVIPGSSFWNNWTQYPFSTTNWNARPLGVQVLALAYRSGQSWNESGYSNPEFDSVLASALGEPDVEKRRALMQEIESTLQSDGVIIQPFWRSLFAHHNDRVHGFQMHQAFEHHFEETYLS